MKRLLERTIKVVNRNFRRGKSQVETGDHGPGASGSAQREIAQLKTQVGRASTPEFTPGSAAPQQATGG